MNSASSQPSAMERAVDNLESVLMQTRVPGELEDWVRKVNSVVSEICELMEGKFTADHRKVFARIVREDIALQPRVKELKDNDATIAELAKATQTLSAAVFSRVDGGEQTAQELDGSTKLFEMGQQLVFDIRKQEESIRTWFLESFQRDRGVSG